MWGCQWWHASEYSICVLINMIAINNIGFNTKKSVCMRKSLVKYQTEETGQFCVYICFRCFWAERNWTANRNITIFSDLWWIEEFWALRSDIKSAKMMSMLATVQPNSAWKLWCKCMAQYMFHKNTFHKLYWTYYINTQIMRNNQIYFMYGWIKNEFCM